MLTTELRKKTDDLEKQILCLIDQFNIEVGECEINIDVRHIKYRNEGEETVQFNRVKVNVTV